MNPLHRRAGFHCPSEILLDRLLAGELAADATGELGQHIEGCSPCQDRRRDRLSERDLFRVTAPPLFAPVPAAPPTDVAHARRRLRPTLLYAATALAAAVALVPLVREPANEDVTRGKGQQALRLYVLHAGAVRQAGSGERVAPGDHLRFALAPEVVRGRHAAILSRDGAGAVTIYFPQRAGDDNRAAVPPSDDDGLFPYSIELDDTVGIERLAVVLCRDAIRLGPVRAALASDDGPGFRRALPAGCSAELHTLVKRRER